MHWPAHHLGGPDFDAYEPIEHPWTREEEPVPEQEPVDAGAIMDVENDPDWANPQQLNRFLPVKQTNAEFAVPFTRQALRAQQIPYSFALIN